MPEVLVNGRPADRVSADDRGLLYGDHLFETVAFVAGRAPLWDWHMARLQHDAVRLLMPPPDGEVLADECRRLLDDTPRAVVRMTITRGSGGRAYEPPTQPRPRRILMRRPWPGAIDRQRRMGLAVGTSPVRLASGSTLAGIKHGNRLEQVLAAERAHHEGLDEALLFDAEDGLIEAIAGNVVVGLDDRAVTPDTSRAGVTGVGLAWLRAQQGVNIETATLGADELTRSSWAVVINSVAGIRPIATLDGRRLAIADECRRWQKLWDRLFECADS